MTFYTRCGFPVGIYDDNVCDSSPFEVHGYFYVEKTDRKFVHAWTALGESTPGEQSELDLLLTPIGQEPEPPLSSDTVPVAFSPPPEPSASAGV